MLPTAFRRPVADRKVCPKVIASGSPKLLQFLGIVLIGVASLLGSSCSFMGFSPSAASQKQVSVTPPAPTVASGGRVQFAATVQNTWNPAVVWSADNGVISRTGLFTAPMVTSGKSLTVTASSVADPSARTSVTVYVTPSAAPQQLAITSLSLPQLQAGIPYAATLTAQGGKTPYRWSVSSGSLPTGLSLNGSTGLISGISAQSGLAHGHAGVHT
jgi:Putative Ig domain